MNGSELGLCDIRNISHFKFLSAYGLRHTELKLRLAHAHHHHAKQINAELTCSPGVMYLNLLKPFQTK